MIPDVSNIFGAGCVGFHNRSRLHLGLGYGTIIPDTADNPCTQLAGFVFDLAGHFRIQIPSVDAHRSSNGKMICQGYYSLQVMNSGYGGLRYD